MTDGCEKTKKRMVKTLCLGTVYATGGVKSSVPREEMMQALGLHLTGDWGDVGEGDWLSNDEALEGDGRILSKYASERGEVFWIVTESDRSATTILLPCEY